jgi:hypothetical protein
MLLRSSNQLIYKVELDYRYVTCNPDKVYDHLGDKTLVFQARYAILRGHFTYGLLILAICGKRIPELNLLLFMRYIEYNSMVKVGLVGCEIYVIFQLR